MPLGISRYDEAVLQQQIWTPVIDAGQSLMLWVDPSAPGACTMSGSNVQTLADQSPSGNTLTNADTTHIPAYAATGYLPRQSLSYPGSAGKNIRRALSANYTGATLQCYVVATLSSAAASSARMVSVGTLGSTEWNSLNSFAFNRASTANSLQITRNSVATTAQTIPLNTPFLVEAIFDGTNMWTAVNGVDGVKLASTAAFNFGNVLLGQSTANYANATLETWGGLIGEVIIDTAAYNARRRALIAGYLSWKWNIGPSNPFRNRPPMIGD